MRAVSKKEADLIRKLYCVELLSLKNISRRLAEIGHPMHEKTVSKYVHHKGLIRGEKQERFSSAESIYTKAHRLLNEVSLCR